MREYIPESRQPQGLPYPIPSITSLVGAQFINLINPPSGSVILAPGDSIQAALNEHAGKSGWIILSKGITYSECTSTDTKFYNTCRSGERIDSFLSPN